MEIKLIHTVNNTIKLVLKIEKEFRKLHMCNVTTF